ncbi:hypothetical protein Taro_008061 [Colocasia esculenta]|uniref:RING-type domain-containing protein n=1 Tax=Colocasia esculenta TaxID=4460 RepID=A0A843U0S4_COLES|nr:hypothetical protein [Colocasia esculenta]
MQHREWLRSDSVAEVPRRFNSRTLFFSLCDGAVSVKDPARSLPRSPPCFFCTAVQPQCTPCNLRTSQAGCPWPLGFPAPAYAGASAAPCLPLSSQARPAPPRLPLFPTPPEEKSHADHLRPGPRSRLAAADHGAKEEDAGNALCCSICLADYKDADVLRRLPDCKHLFHLKCVDPWLRLHPTFPVCRTSPLRRPPSPRWSPWQGSKP